MIDPSPEQIATLLDALVAARDVLATFAKQVGWLPDQHGYSTRMTDSEMQLARAVADLDRIIAEHQTPALLRLPRVPLVENGIATLRDTLELDGHPVAAPIRVAGFLRHYAGIIRKNERWDVPETMANAYESAALQLEKYHAEIMAQPPLAEEGINNGNTFIFCDYVYVQTNTESHGCIRGAGHNGPHVLQQIDDAVRAPVLLLLPEEK